MEQRRGIPEAAKVGRQSTTKIHGFLNVDGLDRFALLVAWHVADLRLPILKEASQDFLLRLPEGRFMGYHFAQTTPSPLWRGDRHHQVLLPPLAREAGQQNRLLMRRTHLGNEEWLLVAAPSEAFDGTILTVGVPTSLVLEPLADKRALLFRLLTLSGLLVILLGWITAERVVPPVRKVQRGLAAIAAGDFTTRMTMARRDELGSLTRAFDEMTLGLVERQRLATLVSPQALDLLAREENLTGHQSFTQAVILVSDIRDFTTLCEQLPVEDITTLLNHHFEEMYQVISSQRGKVDRFIGDAIQAVFEDLGPDQPPSGSRALRAALLMLERLAAINAQRIETGRFTYRVGVGIAEGPILFASLGDPAIRFDSTVLGEPVKTATRLETLSKKVPGCPIVVHPGVNLTGDPLADDLQPLAGHPDEARVFPEPGTKRTDRR
jgi:class 3 adenylate cyclase